MLKRLNSIRYTYIRSHLFGLVLNTFILLAVLLSVYVWFSPSWLSAGAVLLFISCYVLVGAIVAFYAGFKSSGGMKDRIESLSIIIAKLANGVFTAKVYFNEEDEITRIAGELNQLGDKLKQQKESLMRLADEKAEFARSAHKAATIEERQRLARDLHDAVSQQLFALTMMSQAALRMYDKQPEKARAQLEEITTMALQAQTEMRALLLHLRPVHLSGEPLKIGVERLVEELKQKCQINFHMKLEEIDDASRAVEEHLFRIIQEALSNIMRHSNATDVNLELTRKNRELFLHIGDNGDGFDMAEKEAIIASYGLKTMKERCEEIGGDFTIRSREREGTHIDMRIPMQERKKGENA
ncbi:sensor histidine kinase [Thalassobacillus pellis]|uniref:sensor histidine kinase n=1 Tax=Thalassobacillus pellis TaxID=748008 RepID=UPI0019611227|nr:sensor histidine kinase [Thalassobacillus pellis]MBM7554117.1 NarL family two-component system sensor histidine kinase LiaS [Thalassobacillus pellis]